MKTQDECSWDGVEEEEEEAEEEGERMRMRRSRRNSSPPPSPADRRSSAAGLPTARGAGEQLLVDQARERVRQGAGP